MPRKYEDEKPEVHAKATPIPGARRYPVAPDEARDVARRRLAYRSHRRPAPVATEYEIWCEFAQFPDVLGRYVSAGSRNPAQERSFADHWIAMHETADRQIYGEVRPSTEAWIADLLDPLPAANGEMQRQLYRPTLAEKIEVHERALAQARAEGAAEGSRRIRYLTTRIARFVSRQAVTAPSTVPSGTVSPPAAPTSLADELGAGLFD